MIQFENIGLQMQLVDVINLFYQLRTYLLASFAYPIVVRNHGSVTSMLCLVNSFTQSCALDLFNLHHVIILGWLFSYVGGSSVITVPIRLAISS